MQPKIASIQILRGIAALLVVWYHARGFALSLVDQPVGKWESLCAIGVDIFFVISGAIIYQTAFAGRRMAPTTFLRRRLERIVPIYFLVTLAWIPFAAEAGFPVTWQQIISTMTFTPWRGEYIGPALQTGWTLCFEMLFYMSATIALLSRRWAIAVLIVFSAAIIGNIFLGWRALAFIGNPMALEFLAGFTIMRLWHSGRASASPLLMLCVAIAILIALAPPPTFPEVSLLFTSDIAWIRPLIWGIPATLILIATLSLNQASAAKTLSLPMLFGDASYSIYLIHWPLMAVMRAYTVPGWPTSIMLSTVTVAAGVGLHLAIERPLLRSARRLVFQ